MRLIFILAVPGMLSVQAFVRMSIQSLRSISEYRSAIRDSDAVILFGHGSCRVCTSAARVFMNVASQMPNFNFCTANVGLEPIRRIADVLDIDRIPYIAMYSGEDVETFPVTSELLRILPSARGDVEVEWW